MPLSQPHPSLDELIVSIGVAGRRLNDLKATEGAAGNISLYIGWPVEVQRHFPQVEQIVLPKASCIGWAPISRSIIFKRL